MQNTPIRQYERLAEEDRNSRRTIADAIAVLQDMAGFAETHRAQIRISHLKLPSADVVGLVQIVFDLPVNHKAYVVSLPTSTQFRARCPNASRPELFDTAKLHDAILDGAGNVVLADGWTLNAVEVVPARLPLKPTELDWRIIHHTIAFISAEEQCHRGLKDDWYDFLARFKDIVPDFRFIDCSKLSSLNIPSLDCIATHISECNPTLEQPSQQKISDTLRKFGMRPQTPRPRVKARHTNSTIRVG